ncbi:MAG: beta-lactamase family protein [Clostridia bacterium]|nr:beta-lactamase family protein [Clostridia bacterium]
MITHLDRDALRPKVLACIDNYLSISDNYSLTIGMYREGQLYVWGEGANMLELQYDIGSISKTVTAHLILDLVERGVLALEASVDRYLSLPEGGYPTVYELLTHTAGYGHLTPLEITLPALMRHGYAKRNIYEACTAETVLKCLARRKRCGNGAKKRKKQYGYSDFAYAVLAVVAERVTKRPFADLIEDFVQGRLGMTGTVVQADPKTRVPCAVSHDRVLPFWKWRRENPYVAGGGLVSNVEDMLRYLSRQIEDTDPCIAGAHRLCEASLSAGKNEAMCIGWHTYKKSNQLWHVGGVGTFRSSVIFNKKSKFGVVVLGNAKGVASANVHYLAKMLYSEFKIKKIDFEKTV